MGLSIEPGRIAAARVSVNGAITVQDGGRAELDPGVVRDGEVVHADVLAEALRGLWREHKDLGRQVRIGIANARIVVRTMDLPPIDDAGQLATAVRFQAADEIPMALESAVLDFHPVGIVETPQGPRQRVVLVAARRDMIADVLAAVRAAGLRPAGIDLAAFGMIRALSRPQRRAGEGGPELFVSVGGLTNLAVSDQGVCAFTRVAGGGLESLAVELAERRELALDDARGWLHRVGLQDAPADVAGDADIVADARSVLIDGVHRIAAEIRASLDFHHGQVGGKAAVERVVLTGPAVAVPGFATALEAKLGLDLETRVVGGSDAMALDALDAGCLSVAAGLAVRERAA